MNKKKSLSWWTYFLAFVHFLFDARSHTNELIMKYVLQKESRAQMNLDGRLNYNIFSSFNLSGRMESLIKVVRWTQDFLYWYHMYTNKFQRKMTLKEKCHKCFVITTFLLFTAIAVLVIVVYIINIKSTPYGKTVVALGVVLSHYKYFKVLNNYSEFTNVNKFLEVMISKETIIGINNPFLKAKERRQALAVCSFSIIGILLGVIYCCVNGRDPQTKSVFQAAFYFPSVSHIMQWIMVVSVFNSISVITVLDSILIRFICSVCAFFELQKAELDEMGQRKKKNDTLRIIANIRFHQKLLRVFKRMDYVFQDMMWTHLMYFSFYTGLNILDIIKSKAFVALPIIMSLHAMFALAAHCYLGEELKAKSLLIRQAIYFGNWYERTEHQKKLLLTFHLGASPFIIAKHRVFPMEYSSLLVVLSATYKICSVVKGLY